ncbi:hypothetical protein [Streptomyces sp. NPDC002845]
MTDRPTVDTITSDQLDHLLGLEQRLTDLQAEAGRQKDALERRATRAEEQLAAVDGAYPERAQLVDLLKRTEAHLSALHGSVARHDQLAANLACAGCELRDTIRAALAVSNRADLDEPKDR